MASVYTGSTQYVTALTLALLEDSGWYMPNYSVAQNSPFGLGAGCDFVTEKCIQQENVPEWAYGIFCDSGDSVGCTPDKKMVAYCDISRWDGNLPSGYQYFQDPVCRMSASIISWSRSFYCIRKSIQILMISMKTIQLIFSSFPSLTGNRRRSPTE